MKQTSQSLLVPIFILLISTTSAFAYYNPQAGRFMQRDPLGIDPAGGRTNRFRPGRQYTDGMDLYEYVGSQPSNKIDPYGLSLIDMIDKIKKVLKLAGIGPPGGGIAADCAIMITKMAVVAVWPGEGGIDSDSYAHCYFSCRLGQECGLAGSAALGALKEIFDLIGGGNDQMDDLEADAQGLGCAVKTTLKCPLPLPSPNQACDDCCSGHGHDRGGQWLP
ncbi:MAG: hypothetical protein KAR47_21480 [Planctomycetes bacterium]|nr:hypothetical protein [Planctomycetota bacterium]